MFAHPVTSLSEIACERKRMNALHVFRRFGVSVDRVERCLTEAVITDKTWNDMIITSWCLLLRLEVDAYTVDV